MRRRSPFTRFPSSPSRDSSPSRSTPPPPWSASPATLSHRRPVHRRSGAPAHHFDCRTAHRWRPAGRVRRVAGMAAERAELAMVVAWPELQAAAAGDLRDPNHTPPSCWSRRRPRRADAGHDSVQPLPTTSATCSCPVKSPFSSICS
jgi:hypothetical protein